MDRMRLLVTVCAGSIGLWVPASASGATELSATTLASETALITDGVAPTQETAATPSDDAWRFTARPYLLSWSF